MQARELRDHRMGLAQLARCMRADQREHHHPDALQLNRLAARLLE